MTPQAKSSKAGGPQRRPLTRTVMLVALFGTAFSSYMQRVSLSVTGEAMMGTLGISKIHLGWIFNAFLISYALFQVPAGALGDRVGARWILGLTTLACGVLTVLTGVLPGELVRTVSGALVTLALLRLLLGAGQAAVFPVATNAAGHWMPPSLRAFGSSLVLMGSAVGSAATGPLVSWATVHFGWRRAFVVAALPAFVVGPVLLLLRGRPDVGGELTGEVEVASQARGGWLTTDVWLLSLSYFAEGYLLFAFISWLYIYLVEVQHFSLLEGGWASSLPWIAAVAATPLGGLLADGLTVRIGRARASGSLIGGGYALSGSLLFVAAATASRPVAVAALSLSLGALYLAESSFWTTANAMNEGRGGAVSGFMNMVGILGGVASNALIPYLVKVSGWLMALGSATVFGFVTAALWVVLARRLRGSVPGRGMAEAG